MMSVRNTALFFLTILSGLTFMVTGCGPMKSEPKGLDSDTILEEFVEMDTTIYGTCGEGTTMHMLQLVTDQGDTLFFNMNDADVDAGTIVGGILVGDRIAVIGTESEDGQKVIRGINLTTLIGKWTSLDKNFEIQEGGVVSSHIRTESNPWSAWKVLNGKLLLNTDTFLVTNLDADSLYLENEKGIFAYRRQ